MTEIVKEFKTTDGLGAMLWKKIYAMSYAKHYNKLFEDTPFDWFLIHESDGIESESDPKYQIMLDKFNNLLHNPWKDINFDSIPYKTLCPHVGMGAPAPGIIEDTSFLGCAPEFNRFGDSTHNSIVIHIRRGNAIPENPRYVEDSFYFNMLSNIPMIIEKLKLNNPKVVICTDATEKSKSYFPKGQRQEMMWGQPHLYKNETGGYPTTTIDVNLLKDAYKDIEIVNNLDTYDSLVYMMTAKVLVVGNSAFSQSAGLLSRNMVISMPPKIGMDPRFNIFKNHVGSMDPIGNFIY